MTLRCQPGDLAFIVKGRNRDHPVTVERRAEAWIETFCGEPAWWCSTKTPMKNELGQLVLEGIIEDDRLRPIRYPGDDAKDETTVFSHSGERA